MTIDTNNWMEYKLKDVFNVKGGYYNKKPEHSAPGLIPFLAATEANNGVTEFYCEDDIKCWDKVGLRDNTLNNKIFKAPAIAVTVNGSVCNAFFQREDYTCSHDITSLTPRDGHAITQNEALFCCTVIQSEKYRWSYGRKPHDVKKFSEMIIKLPATIYGLPDWDFMNRYIKSLNCNHITTKNKNEVSNVDVRDWKYFKIGDLFEIKKGKRLTANEQLDGTTPYIGAIDSNNGVANHIEQSAIHSGNTITLSYNGSVGEAFYQPIPFWATDDVNVLYFKKGNGVDFNKFIALFICTVLKQEKYRYSYGRKWTMDNMNETLIRLPCKNEKPDWNYMENYMKSLPYGDMI